MESKIHRETVRRSFAVQAQGFGDSALTLSNVRYIEWILGRLPLHQQMKIIDVACGTGIMARSLAPLVQHVTGIDVTPAMVAEARSLATTQGLTNVEFSEAPAEATEFADGTFDMALTRLAVHHFRDPVVQLREMARITRPQGHLAVIDLAAPDDPHLAGQYNLYQRLRDTSHTTALSPKQLQETVREAGVTLISVDTLDVEVNVDRWLGLTKTPENVAAVINRDVDREIRDGGPATGLRPFINAEGHRMFRENWLLVLSVKLNLAAAPIKR